LFDFITERYRKDTGLKHFFSIKHRSYWRGSIEKIKRSTSSLFKF